MLTKARMIAAAKTFRCFLLFFVFYESKVLGKECIAPLGMEDGRIKDMQITITGRARGTSAVGWQARLNKNIPAYGAWCVYVDEGLPYKKNYDQHIQINLLKLTIIAKIATQGREYANGTEHVEDYKISYSNDSHNWMFYKDQTSHETQIFHGNTDASSVKCHILDPTIIARYIRVYPGYELGVNACMRLELYGCVNEKVPSINNEKKFLSGSNNASHSFSVTAAGLHTSSTSAVTSSTKIPVQTNSPPTPECEEKTNSVAMFFVGAAVTLLIGMLVAFVIKIYKRRYQASNSSTNGLKGDSIKMQSQAPPQHPAKRQHKVLELGNVRPVGGETSLYEDVQISPYEVVKIFPSSGYTELNRSGRETTDNSGYQKLMKQYSEHVIPADDETGDYEEVRRLGKCR